MATSTPMTGWAGAATGIASAAQGVAGIIQQAAAFKQQLDAIMVMKQAAEKEMEAIGIHGRETARAAVQRAYAALADSKLLSEMTQANIMFLREQREDTIGTTIAQAAGAGLDFIGAPVLVAAEISLNANRQIQNQLMTERIGKKQFEFEVDQELRNAGLALQGARIATEATAISRGAQIGAASFDAFKTLTTAVNRTSALLSSDGFKSILGNHFQPSVLSTPTDTPLRLASDHFSSDHEGGF